MSSIKTLYFQRVKATRKNVAHAFGEGGEVRIKLTYFLIENPNL